MANEQLPLWLLLRIAASRSRDFAFSAPLTRDLLDEWLDFDLGDRIDRTNHLVEHPSDDVHLIVEGYTETIRHRGWAADLNAEPFDPWRIAVVSDPAPIAETPRIGSGTAVLAAGYDSDDLSFSVTTGAGGLWTTSAADFPLDIAIGGERIRLSAISGSSSPQTFTVSARSVNGVVKSHSAGARVEPWRTATVGL